MFTTSGDILNLVLATCIAVLTVFLSIAIYYFISSAHKIHKLISLAESGIMKAEELVSLIRDKVKNSSAYVMLFAEVAKQAMEYAKNKGWGKKTESKKKK